MFACLHVNAFQKKRSLAVKQWARTPFLSSGSWRFPTNKNCALGGLASLDKQKGDHWVFNLCAFLFLDDTTQRGETHFLLLLCDSLAVEMPSSWLIEYSEHNRDRWLIFRLICLVFQMTTAYSLVAPGMPLRFVFVFSNYNFVFLIVESCLGQKCRCLCWEGKSLLRAHYILKVVLSAEATRRAGSQMAVRNL